jgi:hypothetical protein
VKVSLLKGGIVFLGKKSLDFLEKFYILYNVENLGPLGPTSTE